MSKIIKISLVVFISLIILIGIFLSYLFTRREYEIKNMSTYYQELAKVCKEKESFSCCMSSVKNMAKGNYKIRLEIGCPEDSRVNTLKCIDSYVWCESSNKEKSTIRQLEPFRPENSLKESNDSSIKIELKDNSPVNEFLTAYLGGNGNKEGIYLFNAVTKKTTVVYELTINQGDTGRGGYYMDNRALEFSPTGEAFFVNVTGRTHFPSFFVIRTADGHILHSGGDPGHATWISGHEIVFLGTGNRQPQVYNIKTLSYKPTALPKDVIHLLANKDGTKIRVFSRLEDEEYKCDNFNLYVYSYPEGIELFSESNVDIDIGRTWLDENTITFNKIIDCKEDVDSFSGYSPITEEKQVTIQN